MLAILRSGRDAIHGGSCTGIEYFYAACIFLANLLSQTAFKLFKFYTIYKQQAQMGNQQAKHSEDGLQNHQRMGPVRIIEYQDRQNDQIISTMELHRYVQSERVIQNWRAQIIRIDDTQAKQILILPQKFEFQKGGMCGASGTVHIVYQNLSYVLKGEIENRFKINRYFDEREIWYLLYNMIRAGNKFERIKKKIGNMHPNNILINDDGQIKIIATCSVPGEIDNFELMTQNIEAYAFLAPQQLANDAVQNAKYPPNVNQCLAEVFSIGLTILSAGTLLDCQDVYEKRKDSIKINQNALQNLLKYFRQRYSLFLSDIVTDMVAINPHNRKHSSDIYEMLYQFENQILDLQPFSPPERYVIPSQTHLTGNSTYLAQNHAQERPMGNSITYGSNVYTHPQVIENRNMAPMVVHQPRMQRSNMPVQVMTSSHMPEHMGYSNQFRQVISPTGQQSSIYAPNQSFIPPGASSSMMHGSIHPIQQSHHSNLSNINIAQSNYIPNYQFRH